MQFSFSMKKRHVIYRLKELVTVTRNDFQFNQQLNAVRNLCNEDPCDEDANIADRYLPTKMNNLVNKLKEDFMPIRFN